MPATFIPEGTTLNTIGVAMIGCGGIALQNHLPGCALDKRAKLVALCDSNPAVLDKAKQTTGLSTAFTDYHDVLKHPGVAAVVIATPNFVHAPMAIAAAEAKKHVLCEKPIAMSF